MTDSITSFSLDVDLPQALDRAICCPDSGQRKARDNDKQLFFVI